MEPRSSSRASPSRVFYEIILKCDGDQALKTSLEEVRRQRSEKTILENSPVGDRRANGAAERAVQATAEQVRVIRRGLEQRLETTSVGEASRLCMAGVACGGVSVEVPSRRRWRDWMRTLER